MYGRSTDLQSLEVGPLCRLSGRKRERVLLRVGLSTSSRGAVSGECLLAHRTRNNGRARVGLSPTARDSGFVRALRQQESLSLWKALRRFSRISQARHGLPASATTWLSLPKSLRAAAMRGTSPGVRPHPAALTHQLNQLLLVRHRSTGEMTSMVIDDRAMARST